jgi:hypothetical protein
MSNVARQVSEYWEDINQYTLLGVLSGIFAMTGADNLKFVDGHTYDISADDAPDDLVDPATLNSAIQQASGDRKNRFSLVIMHSVIATNLENMKLLDYMKQTGGSCKIYTEQVKQGLTEPCFFVLCEDCSEKQIMGKRRLLKHLFYIQYIPIPESSYADCNNINELLYRALRYLPIGENWTWKIRRLTWTSISHLTISSFRNPLDPPKEKNNYAFWRYFYMAKIISLVDFFKERDLMGLKLTNI